MRSRFIVIKTLDDAGHEAIVYQSESEADARRYAAACNAEAQYTGTRYRVICEVRRPRLAGWRRVPA